MLCVNIDSIWSLWEPDTVDIVMIPVSLLNTWDKHFQMMAASLAGRIQTHALTSFSRTTVSLTANSHGPETVDPAHRAAPCDFSESAPPLQHRCSCNYDAWGKFSVFNGPPTRASTSSVTCQSNSTLRPKSLVSLRSCKLQRTDLQLWCIIQSISWKCMSVRFFFPNISSVAICQNDNHLDMFIRQIFKTGFHYPVCCDVPLLFLQHSIDILSATKSSNLWNTAADLANDICVFHHLGGLTLIWLQSLLYFLTCSPRPRSLHIFNGTLIYLNR